MKKVLLALLATLSFNALSLDAVTVLTVMGMATERLGLGATYSTSYYEPFHVARLFGTLDLMTKGRAAWNVVTSQSETRKSSSLRLRAAKTSDVGLSAPIT